jgi:hypothetical protein
MPGIMIYDMGTVSDSVFDAGIHFNYTAGQLECSNALLALDDQLLPNI